MKPKYVDAKSIQAGKETRFLDPDFGEIVATVCPWRDREKGCCILCRAMAEGDPALAWIINGSGRRSAMPSRLRRQLAGLSTMEFLAFIEELRGGGLRCLHYKVGDTGQMFIRFNREGFIIERVGITDGRP